MTIEGFDEEPPLSIPEMAECPVGSDRPADVFPHGLFHGTRAKCNRYSFIDFNSMLRSGLLPGLHTDA